MDNQRVIELLDEIDRYLMKNVDANGKIKNSLDIYARMHIQNIAELKKYLESKGEMKGSIKTRVEQTENALLYAIDRTQLNTNNKYFNWIKSQKQQKNPIKPNDEQIYYDICTGHRSIVRSNYAKEYLPEIPGIEELIHSMGIVEQEYENFLNRTNEKQQETALVVRKRNIIQRFFDRILHRGAYQKQQQTVEPNYEKATDREYGNVHRAYCEQLSDYRNYNNTYQQPKQEMPEQVIAVSDLHGNMDKWQAIKKQMRTNPNTKLIILGDAVDRGEYGIEILLQIKELCDKGKAEYLPGNHDVFVYNYEKVKGMLLGVSDKAKLQSNNLIKILGRDTAHLKANGGETTLASLENFDRIVRNEIKNGNISNRIGKKELIDWLGRQPIQKKIKTGKTTYALAHAYFDDELYSANSTFNLEQALQLEMAGRTENNIFKKFQTIMWYREHNPKTHFSPVKFPKGCVMVVGHTPQKEGINARKFHTGEWDEQIIYIDTGNNIAALDLTNGRSLNYKTANEGR